MSSANRGRARNKDDLYETAYWLIEQEVPRLRELLRGIKQPVIWEPCAGNGRITRVLKHFFPDALIYSTDIGDYEGLDRCGVDFLQADSLDYLDVGAGPLEPDLIISNPPFFIAQEIIQHAQKLVKEGGYVVMLERLNFLGTKKREPWLTWDPPSSNISPRRCSFLPTRQCDSIEYGWFEFRHRQVSDHTPREYGEMRLMNTMSCKTCGEVHFDKACPGCDYGYCKTCYKDHEEIDCKANLFGKDSLWYCYNHPERPMTNACKAKGCSLPFCDECWAEHDRGNWRACQVDMDEYVRNLPDG